jgi:hypothetical protein
VNVNGGDQKIIFGLMCDGGYSVIHKVMGGNGQLPTSTSTSSSMQSMQSFPKL